MSSLESKVAALLIIGERAVISQCLFSERFALSLKESPPLRIEGCVSVGFSVKKEKVV